MEKSNRVVYTVRLTSICRRDASEAMLDGGYHQVSAYPVADVASSKLSSSTRDRSNR